MEKKTTQRIIGILVVIALVIILLPLMFGKNELVTQASMKAPPFPDQQKAESAPAADDAQQIAQAPADPATANAQQPAEANAAQPTLDPNVAQNQNDLNTNAAQPNPTTDAQPNQEPAAPAVMGEAEKPSVTKPDTKPDQSKTTKNEVAPKQVNTKDAANAAQDSLDITPAIASEMNDGVAAPQDAQAVSVSKSAMTPDDQVVTAPTSKKKDAAIARPEEAQAEHADKTAPEKISAMKSTHTLSTASAQRRSIKIKTAAWVVQMGSFKDKANARHLTDKLRAAGFKAFTHEVRTPKSTSTRVWVGPEDKQASAAKLSNQIEQQMNMHGILVKFKPMEL